MRAISIRQVWRQASPEVKASVFAVVTAPEHLQCQVTALTRFVAVMALLALGGCAATGDVDSQAPHWLAVDSVPTPDGCPDLAGQYENRASAAYPGSVTDAATLTDVFNAMAQGVTAIEPGRSWTVPHDARYASIEQDGEDLMITFVGEDGARASQSFHRLRIFRSDSRLDETFTCYVSKGTARMRFPMAPLSHQSDSAAPLYMGGRDVYVQFYKGKDGALILQTVDDKVGLSLVVIGSHFSRESRWSRFAPIDEMAQKVDDR